MKAKTIKLFGIIMMLVMGMSFNACSSDDDNDDDGGDVSDGLIGYYTDGAAQTSDFDIINEAINNEEVLYDRYSSTYIASRDLFIDEDGSYSDIGYYYGRLYGTIQYDIRCIQIANDNTILYYFGYLYEDGAKDDSEAIYRLYAGEIFGNMTYYGSSVYYTYQKIDNKLFISNGDIFTITDKGLIKDGSSDIWSKYNPQKIYGEEYSKDEEPGNEPNIKPTYDFVGSWYTSDETGYEEMITYYPNGDYNWVEREDYRVVESCSGTWLYKDGDLYLEERYGDLFINEVEWLNSNKVNLFNYEEDYTTTFQRLSSAKFPDENNDDNYKITPGKWVYTNHVYNGQWTLCLYDNGILDTTSREESSITEEMVLESGVGSYTVYGNELRLVIKWEDDEYMDYDSYTPYTITSISSSRMTIEYDGDYYVFKLEESY